MFVAFCDLIPSSYIITPRGKMIEIGSPAHVICDFLHAPATHNFRAMMMTQSLFIIISRDAVMRFRIVGVVISFHFILVVQHIIS